MGDLPTQRHRLKMETDDGLTMNYHEFIKELERLIERAQAIHEAGIKHNNTVFRKWRHDAESLFALAERKNSPIPGPFKSNIRAYLALRSGASEQDHIDALRADLHDSLIELEFVVNHYRRYGTESETDREQTAAERVAASDQGVRMAIDHSFKRHAITADQKLWLAEVDRAFPNFSPRAARLALEGRVAPGSTPDAIDVRLYRSKRLTAVGLWHVNPQHPRLLGLDKTIRAIRQRILAKPDLQAVTSAEIASDTGLSETQVGEAMFAAGEVGTGFFSQAEGMPGSSVAHAKLHFRDDDSADDDYLNYTGIEDLLERFYVRVGNALQVSLSVSDRMFGGIQMREQSPHSKKVFIVHGRNSETKDSVARFIEKLGLQAVILHERPNIGRTIITKFQEESQGVGFAVVLMTPDDEGRLKDESSLNSRARQNVVFELGFFIGRLGSERVVAMVKGKIDKPSDFDGVLYISLDEADWPMRLVKELKAASLEGDWSKMLS